MVIGTWLGVRLAPDVKGRIDCLRKAEVRSVVGEQLIDGHVVEAREPLKSGHRDRSFATLIGTQNRGLELLGRARLDFLEREPLLAADGPQPLADSAAVSGVVGFLVHDVLVER